MLEEVSNLSDYNDDDDLELASIDSKMKSLESKSSINAFTANGVHDQINFMNFTQQYCIGFIDIVNSTLETARIKDPKKLRKYYSLFLNSMSAILNQHSGKIIKSSGDNLFFYFPKTSNHDNKQALQEVFDCSQSMFESKKSLDNELLREGLPSISFRISMEYGMVEVALGSNNKEVDLFGSVVNECAKINSLSRSDGLSIGEGLYSILIESGFSHDFETQENKLPINKNSNSLILFYTVFDKRINRQIEGTGMSVPLDQDTFIKEITTSPSSISTNSENKSFNILVIDDDADILHTYRALLKRYDYKVESFSNPLEALKHITGKKTHSYDLVIMDIRMPGISGIKLFYMFKAIDPYIKILFVTALDLVGEFVDALPDIKMNEIARKPLSEEQFIAAVKKRLADKI